MPLDPTIALQVKAPNIYNAVQQGTADAISNQAGQTANAINTDKLQALPQQLQTEQAKSQLDLQSTQLANAKAHAQAVGQLLGSAVDQPTYDAAKSQATKLGIDVSDEPAQYDPDHVKSLQMGALDAAQKIDLAQKQLQMSLNQQKLGIDQQNAAEKLRHDKASEGIAATRPLVTYLNGAGAFADPAVTAKLGGAPNPTGTISNPGQLPAGTLQPPTVGATTGAPSGTATLGAPSFAPNPAASPTATGVPQGVQPVTTASGDATPSFYQRAPQQQALLQKVADYQMTPQEAFGKAGGAKSMAMAALATDFPNYDSTHYAEKVATVKDYSPGGKDGQKYQSLNQLGSHLAEGDKLFSALGNTSFIPENQLVNYAKQITGNADINNASLAKAAISDETGRLMRGVGMSDAESEKYAGALSNASSPAQFQGALNTIADLVGGRMKSLNFGYDQALGTPGAAAQKFIDPQTKAILVKHSPGLAKDLGVSAPVSSTPVASLPAGAKQIGTSGGKPVYATPDGKHFMAQ